MTDYDETQAIGRRYRRQDEIGTPLCVTVDFESLDDQAVTIRDRDTMEQSRVPIDEPGRRRATSASLGGDLAAMSEQNAVWPKDRFVEASDGARLAYTVRNERG